MAVCPLASWRPVQNHSGPLSGNLGLILHVQEGDNSLAAYFNNRSVGASSTFWAAKDGRLEQYVDSSLRAWAQAAGNSWYCSVETEGFSTSPLTDQQIATLARLYAWGHDTHGWPYQLAEAPMQHGFGWHGMGGAAFGGHYDCPGDLRRAQRSQILAAAQGAAPAPQPSGDDMTQQQVDALTLYAIDSHNKIGALVGGGDFGPFIEDLYVNLLGRASDPAGKAAWVAALRSGTNPADIVTAFLSTPEANTQAVATVKRLYLADLGRPVDPAGLAAWVDQMTHHGLTEAQLDQALKASPEGKAYAAAHPVKP